MLERNRHQQEVEAFLERQFSSRAWEFSIPQGRGNETYFARGGEQSFFVKLGAQTARYRILASAGVTPAVLADGMLEDGTSILVQTFIAGITPSWKEYRLLLDEFASTIHTMHHCRELQEVLPPFQAGNYRALGLQALGRLRQKWARHRAQVTHAAGFVDHSLDVLETRIADFHGTGLAACHNDICNANWIVGVDGRLYLVDLETMSLEDPALDIGATLWWYYPPELRQRFLHQAGYADDEAIENRMQVRMAMHCLDILLPRENSFDPFDPAAFAGCLADFRAVMAGEQNPQGYCG